MLNLIELLFILAPSYVWRFTIFGVPTNALEILVGLTWVAFAVWLSVHHQWGAFRKSLREQPVPLVWLMAAFFVAGIISVVVSPARDRALGLFAVFFVEPMVTYFMAAYVLHGREAKVHFVKVVLWTLAVFSVYGIFQYFTRIGLPVAWWGNANEPKRALSVFAYPNAFGLYLGSLMAFVMPAVFEMKSKKYYALYAVAAVGLLLTLSRGAWLAVVAAAVVYGVIAATKKVRQWLLVIAAIAIVLIAAVPNLRYRVILPFMGEKSTVSRYSLWDTGEKMIASSPIVGKGLFGFATDFSAYNTDPNLQPIDFPHNIFLNFWIETGLLGLLSFVGISLYLGWDAFKNRRDVFQLGLLLFLVAIYVHGIVDVPYLKNDLALIFWITCATAA
jgi:putative inorganic carbon (HCO3(-)) transporter